MAGKSWLYTRDKQKSLFLSNESHRKEDKMPRVFISTVQIASWWWSSTEKESFSSSFSRWRQNLDAIKRHNRFVEMEAFMDQLNWIDDFSFVLIKIVFVSHRSQSLFTFYGLIWPTLKINFKWSTNYKSMIHWWNIKSFRVKASETYHQIDAMSNQLEKSKSLLLFRVNLLGDFFKSYR